jgi:hypothetical protein
MFHLLKIDEIKHIDKDGKTLWEQSNINNIFHLQGQSFILNAMFNTSASVTVPSSYYLGLDNRTTPALSDVLATSLSGEPTQNGYSRQSVSSLNGFSIAISSDGNYRATSSIVTFSASGGSWGPVKNLFLASSSGISGHLISSSTLDSSRTLLDGQSITMRISVGLGNC